MLGTAYTFQALGENGLWWTSTMQQPATAWSRYLWYLNAGVDRNPVPKTIPLSIRCIRDAGVGLGETDRPVIRIFPNPARDKISIELSGRREANVAVHDLSGRDVFHGTVVVTSPWIDISGLAPGIYLITLTGSFRTVTEKFSKE